MDRFGHVAALTGGCLLLLSVASGARSQIDPTEREVRAAVEHVLELIGGLRFYALPQYFTEDANVITVRGSRSGFSHTVETASAWIETLMQSPQSLPFMERLDNVLVTVDNDHLAVLRADFEIVRIDKKVATGVNIFTLVREEDGWKIASVAYTSIPEIN